MPGIYDHAKDITSALPKNDLFIGRAGNVVTCLFMPKMIVCSECGFQQSVIPGQDIGKEIGRWYLLETHKRGCRHYLTKDRQADTS